MVLVQYSSAAIGLTGVFMWLLSFRTCLLLVGGLGNLSAVDGCSELWAFWSVGDRLDG